jgi:phosphoglycerol transferase MdoB-like AlkP superfamily enzyme
MRSLFSFYLRYIVFFLGIQVLFHIVFLITYQDLARDVSIGDQILSLGYGLKLDISLTGYLLLFPTLMLAVISILRTAILKTIVDIYTFLIILCLVPAYLANLVIYSYWRIPIDYSIFAYFSKPREMMASLSPLFSILLFGILILVIYALFFQAYNKWISRLLIPNRKRHWLAAALFLFILPALYLPIRGGLATSPIQVASVYFHEDNYLNHAATNPVWNLIYTIIEHDKLSQSLNFYPDGSADRMMDELHKNGRTGLKILNTDSPDVILIILESFGQLVIDELGGNGKVAPNFNQLVKEGVFFSGFYTTGVLTDRAIGALFAGYPGIPGTCIIHYENKVQKLPNLNLELKSEGYSSAFLYGGDIDFAHIRSFLVMGGFDRIISDKDFPRSMKISSWGVPDEYLFERLTGVTDQASSPFFHVLMTLSSHSPFDVPMEPVFPGPGHLKKYENSIYYTDRCLGEFIRKAKSSEWWDQALIILVADHGFRVKHIPAHDPKRFNIPMLWLGGALAVSDTIITKYGSQTDLPATLFNQMGLPSGNFKFSKDILSDDTESFAYYTYNEGIGFVRDSSCTVYSLIKGDYLLREGYRAGNAIDPGLAYTQCLINDFNDY